MSSSPAQAVVEVLLEFLEALIHQILFVREIYRPELFERRRLYGVAVRRARHPELCAYIHDVVDSLKDSLARGTLAKVAVVILSPGGEAVERFVVEPRVLGLGGGTATAAAAAAGGGRAAPGLDVGEVEAQLRACVLKLQYVDSSLRRPPPGCSFEVAAYCAGRSALPAGAWAEEDAGGSGALEVRAPGAALVPVKSCTVEGAFGVQLFAEGLPPE